MRVFRLSTDGPYHSPSDALAHDACPACFGQRVVVEVLDDGELAIDCPTCAGEGTLEAMWRVLDAEP